MKVLRYLLIYPLCLVAAMVLMVVAIVWQRDLVSEQDLEFLAELGRDQGWSAVYHVVKVELFGVDKERQANPAYDRIEVPGRGHTPWALRGNLDGRPRMLKLALAPGLWAAYDTEQASLYQVWEGEVLFEGAAYDYRHGPQPGSQGRWYLRHETPAQWFLGTGPMQQAASVEYLGHRYDNDYSRLALHYALVAGEQRVELLEYPDVKEREGRRYFSRTFNIIAGSEQQVVSFKQGSGERVKLRAVHEWPLEHSTEISPYTAADRGRRAESSELKRGAAVISDSDCLGCHAEKHRVAGPAWSEIARRFHGKLQREVITSLVTSIRQGSSGKWGKIPMPAHKNLSIDQTRDAVAYILQVDQSEQEMNPPLNARGEAYRSSDQYDIRPRLTGQHPSFRIENLAPDGFEPKVGGMDFRADGKLVIASWDADGAVYLVDPAALEARRVKRIAQGLHEPLGLAVVDGRLFVLQKQELTELVDTDGDEVIDEYRAFSYNWSANSNFHSFAFGLVHQQDAFYFLLSLCVLPGGASCPEQLATQGKMVRVDMHGNLAVYASGFRTPNGIAVGPDGDLFVNDNQGDFLPSSKLLHVREGLFYGSRAVASDRNVAERVEAPPVVWLPQDEIGNSPTEPLLLKTGVYSGQMVHGDVYNGGLKRVSLDKVAGQWQGAAYHFSSGFIGAPNRLKTGPDGAIYVGEIGNPPNWGEFDKAWHGLERMSYQGNQAFEILAVTANSDGFTLELTQPLDSSTTLAPGDLVVKQWFYHPNEQYGGPKYNEHRLAVSSLELAENGRTMRAVIPGLQAGYVVYLRLNDRLQSANQQPLWTSEAWYTLNAIPSGPPAPKRENWIDLFDGYSLAGWRNYGGDERRVRKWVADSGVLALRQEDSLGMVRMAMSYLLGGGSTDLIYHWETFRNFELSLEWKISAKGNSGIFYLVRDEAENVPWLTGIEMQILDNDGHADGKIKTHRAGDLYDLVSANPQPVLPVGQWNKARIKVQDNLIEHWLNGKRVLSIKRGGTEWNKLVAGSKFADMPGFGQSEEGYLVLQDHSDPVWYRNIRVRRLD